MESGSNGGRREDGSFISGDVRRAYRTAYYDAKLRGKTNQIYSISKNPKKSPAHPVYG